VLKKMGTSLCAVFLIALIALTLVPLAGCSPTDVTGIFEAFFGENDVVTETVREVEADADYQEGYTQGSDYGFDEGYMDAMNGVYVNEPKKLGEKATDAYLRGYCSGYADSYENGYYTARRERPDIEQTIK
jgi:hypothetical protein